MTDKKTADPKASQNYSTPANPTIVDEHGTQFLDLRKSDSERLRVHVKEYKGRTYIDVRVWYMTSEGGFRPSSKGITLRPTMAPELMQGIDLAARSIDPKEAA